MKIFTDLAVDLGTQNIRIISSANETIINEPSLVATKDGKLVAVGKEVQALSEDKKDYLKVHKPIINGKIADITSAKFLIHYFIKKAMSKYSLIKPRVIVAVPYGIETTHKVLIKEIFLQNGARKCFLIEQPMALAIGAGTDIRDSSSNLIVDIGVNSARVNLVSLGGLVFCKSISKDNLAIELSEILKEIDIEFIQSIHKRGITLAGGGALKENLATEIASKLNIKVKVAEDPELSVILGCKSALKEIDLLSELFEE